MRLIHIILIDVVLLFLFILIAYINNKPVSVEIDNSEQTTEEAVRIVSPYYTDTEKVEIIIPTPIIIQPTEDTTVIDEDTTEIVDDEYITIVSENITAETTPNIQQWWTDEELDMLAAVIYYEAGSNDCSDRHQQLVAQVVLNRVTSNKFPNTIYEVITQQNPIQYSTYKLVLRDMGNVDIIPQRCYDNALKALYDEVDCPDNIIWQANFEQGSGVYEEHKTSYSVTYFCY